MLRKQLELVIKILIYLCFFVPLLVIPSSFIFPFIVPKIVVLRTLIEIMLGAYVLLLIINWQEYKPKVTPLTLAVIMFYIISFGLSTFIGVDAYHSFWDNHERMLGFFTIIHYFAFYLLCGNFLKKWTDWKWALRFFLFAGSIVMFIGLLQVGNPNLLLNQGSDRVASTLGNSIYVGGYALFLTFVGFLLMMKDKNNLWKGVYAFLMIFSVLGMFFSGTRGSMLGLVAGAGICILVYALAIRESQKTRLTLFGIMAFAIIIIGILYANRQTDFVKNLPAVGRTVNTSLADVKGSARWVAWEIAWKGFEQKPFFGWGPNNFFYTFNLNYNPRSLDFGYGETWFDNAHNIVMNTLAVQGGVGLLSYLALFVVAIYVLISAYRRKLIDHHLLAIGCGFIVAHFVNNVTVFENITSYLYFMFWLAMINQLTIYKEQLAKEEANPNMPVKADKQIGAGAIAVVGLATFFVVYVSNIQPARANMMTLDAIKGLSSDPVIGLERMKIALAFNSPHIDDIRSDISRTATQLLMQAGQNINIDLAKNIATISYDELSKNTTLHPLDVRNFLSLAQLAQIRAYQENNGLYLQEAEGHLKKALETSPRRQQVMYSFAMLEMQMNKPAEGEKLLVEAIAENPRIGESYWRLAYLYRYNKNDKKAQEVMALAAKNGVVFTDQDKSALAQIFPPATSTTSTKK